MITIIISHIILAALCTFYDNYLLKQVNKAENSYYEHKLIEKARIYRIMSVVFYCFAFFILLLVTLGKISAS